MTYNPSKNCGKCKFFRGAPNMLSPKGWCLHFTWEVSKAYNDPENRAPTCANYETSEKYKDS
jgi:hypothetical protein